MTPAKGRNASTARPVTAPLQRVRAPALWLIALRENDPPTGKPEENAAAMFAVPWLTNSRSGFQRERSMAAYVRAIAAGSANPTNAMMRPGMRSSKLEAQGRSVVIGGIPAGMPPTFGPEYPAASE